MIANLLLNAFLLPSLPPLLSPIHVLPSSSFLCLPLFLLICPSGSSPFLLVFPSPPFPHFLTSIYPLPFTQLCCLNFHPPILLSPEVHLPVAEEKDYFTVTDELSKENSHFALSEALLVVIEQVGWRSRLT